MRYPTDPEASAAFDFLVNSGDDLLWAAWCDPCGYLTAGLASHGWDGPVLDPPTRCPHCYGALTAHSFGKGADDPAGDAVA